MRENVDEVVDGHMSWLTWSGHCKMQTGSCLWQLVCFEFNVATIMLV
jgi:hypothetical protein